MELVNRKDIEVGEYYLVYGKNDSNRFMHIFIYKEDDGFFYMDNSYATFLNLETFEITDDTERCRYALGDEEEHEFMFKLTESEFVLHSSLDKI